MRALPLLAAVSLTAGCFYVVKEDPNAPPASEDPSPPPVPRVITVDDAPPPRDITPDPVPVPPPPPPTPTRPIDPPAPPPPERPDPRVLASRMILEVQPAKRSFLAGENVPVRVVLINGNDVPVTVYEMRKGFMVFELTELETRQTRTCASPADVPRRIRPDRFYGLPARGRIDKSVHLDGFCQGLGPGRYRVDLSYRVPASFDGYAFGYDSFVGTLRASTEIVLVEPQARANLSLHLGRLRRTRADEPFNVEVRLHNHGPDGVFALSPRPPSLQFEVRGPDGRSVACRPLTRRTRAGMVFVEPQRDLTETIDLANICDLGEPGRYELSARYGVTQREVDTLLRPADRKKGFSGEVLGNALPFMREAAVPRASIALEVTGPTGVVPADQPVTVVVRAHNEGPDLVALPPPSLLWVTADVRLDNGRAVPCRRPSTGGQPRLDVLAGAVPPRTAAVGRLDLNALCIGLEPGRYRVSFTYAVPDSGVTVNWRRREVPVWSGSVKSAPVPITLGRAATPTPPSVRTPPTVRRYTPTGGSTEADSQGGHAAEPARLPPWVSLVPPPSIPTAGSPVEVTFSVQAPEGRRFPVARPQTWMLSFTVRDQYGRVKHCAAPAQRASGPTRRDFIVLEGERTATLTMDLAMICGVTTEGSYNVTAQFHIPRRWDGREARQDAWTGTVATHPISLRVQHPARRGTRR